MVSSGILLVDKPGGLTSHDIVARTRRALGTRKVGHAGTLDPMATGLLVIGVENATRLLTFIVGANKTYTATIRLGRSTTTDDAEGEVVAGASGVAIDAVTADRLTEAIATLTGDIEQVPSAVSAIKVDGRRAYDRVRAGEEVTLAARPVTVSRFDVQDRRDATASPFDDASDRVIDLDVIVDCSSGTYIRALARDLGAALGVGGHLTVLRRTHVGPFSITDATDLDNLAEAPLLSPASAASQVLPRIDMSADDARDLRHGKRLTGRAASAGPLPAAAIDPDGELIGIVDRRGADLRSTMNMPEEAS